MPSPCDLGEIAQCTLGYGFRFVAFDNLYRPFLRSLAGIHKKSLFQRFKMGSIEDLRNIHIFEMGQCVVVLKEVAPRTHGIDQVKAKGFGIDLNSFGDLLYH